MRTRLEMCGIGVLVVSGMVGVAGAQEGKGMSLLGDQSGARGFEAPVTGVELLAIDRSGGNGLAVVNTSPPSATNFVVDVPEVGACPEIEYGQDGFLYALDTGDNTQLHRLDAVTGAHIKTFTITFPVGFDVATAAEWIDGALVLGLATEGGAGNAGLGLLELNEGDNTASFGFTVNLGIAGALGGLAVDTGASEIFAVTAAGGTPRLLRIDASGVILDDTIIKENGATAPNLTALEFGPDGQLYALPSNMSGRAGELFLVGRFNAQAVSLGDTGNDGLNGLTTHTGCNGADLAAPFGQLDFSDVIAFLSLFGAGCP